MVLLKLCTSFAEFPVILIQLGIKVTTIDRWWDYHSLEKRGGTRLTGCREMEATSTALLASAELFAEHPQNGE